MKNFNNIQFNCNSNWSNRLKIFVEITNKDSLNLNNFEEIGIIEEKINVISAKENFDIDFDEDLKRLKSGLENKCKFINKNEDFYIDNINDDGNFLERQISF